MKVYNKKQNSYDMLDGLKKELEFFRKKRNFKTNDYINQKCIILNKYMQQSGLDACVIACSGGIDSSVVLALVKKASECENSPIKKIVPLLLPCYNDGATDQKEITERAKVLCEKLKLEPIIFNLTDVNEEYEKMTKLLNIESDSWSRGQLVDYSRKPAENYATTLLNVAGFKAITIGTINMSEYGYIGYFGKFGDSLSDIQLISDIYKSEVYLIAKELNIPKSIIDVKPSGNMYDGRTDEDVFCTTYDFIELYYNYLNLDNFSQKKLINNFNDDEKQQFQIFAENLETLHKYNLHKYFVKSPSVHLDLWPSGIKNGFDNYYYNTMKILKD